VIRDDAATVMKLARVDAAVVAAVVATEATSAAVNAGAAFILLLFFLETNVIYLTHTMNG